MRILKEKKVKGLWKNLENKKKREAIRKLKMKKKETSTACPSSMGAL